MNQMQSRDITITNKTIDALTIEIDALRIGYTLRISITLLI
jgi:hypothetical protein